MDFYGSRNVGSRENISISDADDAGGEESCCQTQARKGTSMCNLCLIPLEEIVGYKLAHTDPDGPMPPTRQQRKQARSVQLKDLIRRYENTPKKTMCNTARSVLTGFYQERNEN